ncbi:MAG: DUF523 domain-containing protein [Deltaproteobacteria bacterium]|nr:DUF523 domain-containing protein [Deltaproteobacteria bacterium]MBT7713733.1 DUF523 domain-containing protein [Deltaproteobacteria bacterium]
MIAISMCLLGINCNYVGKNNKNEKAVDLFRAGEALAVCPEQLAGFTTPRVPAEIIGDRVVNQEGQDVTRQFQKGVDEAIKLVQLAGCTKALLKARSPSCGCGKIYDGSFSHTVIDGDGRFAKRLKKLGIAVETEESWSDLSE